MKHPHTDDEQKSGKPYDIRERLMLFACEVVRIAQELHHRGLKESRRRLRILRLTGYLKEKHDPAIEESTELVKIVATIIRNSERNEAQRGLTNKERR